MKKKILYIVRRGLLEFEYVLPILQKFSSRYEICTIFLNYKSYKSLKSNPHLFSKWKKLNKKFYIQKKYHFIIFKFFRYILHSINITSLTRIKKAINYRLHNPEVLINKVKLNDLNEIKYIITEYGNFSIWIKNFYEIAIRPKIIYFPSSPQIFLNKKKVNERKKKLYGDLLLNISDREKNFWSAFIDKKKIKPIGVPYFNSNKFYKITKKKKKSLLIALNSHSTVDNDYFFFKNNKLFFENLEKLKNVRIIIKPHPFKQSQKMNNLIFSYQKLYKNFFVSNKLISELCKTTDVMVCNLETSASIYGLLYKLPIIGFPFENLKNNILTDNQKLGFILKTNSLSDFVKKINSALYRTNSHVWLNQQKNFKRCYFKKKHSINQIIQVIENYKYERNN